MVKALKERWKSKSSKLGLFLQRWVAGFFAVCAVCASALDYASLIPHDWIPMELKALIAALAFIGWVVGKLTKKDGQDTGPEGEVPK